jgi:hypothetical protein
VKIQEQDIYHGAALTQIAEHPSFKALNKGSERYGHYLVNADCHIFVKYARSDEGPWVYNIQPEQLEPLRNIVKSDARGFLCLVCGHVTICALDEDEIAEVIDVDADDGQWIRVEAPAGGGCRVIGSLGKLRRVVPHNSFPKKLFVE